ncbi:MarR family winged helix-turn-helix transcriptional regulator [Arthrobacter sp. zg-Y40]|uniref:MarR family winged helix-turn-helix transcriptional regulator n=1 Tax=Arthrobacter sp. zg-Y40 TaxID=2886939 RepID=UPI001D15ACE6|nr:MarR family winged helix-turn-helix transcriptional regulator [Arthrobacter sp. zg-Y40]
MNRTGADLALLLLAAYRQLVEDATAELAARGYADIRPVHDFALRAIDAGADTASELGRATAVTKQAAAKTIAVLLERGYAERRTDEQDARRKRLTVTPLGHRMLREGEAVFDGLRAAWASRIGAPELGQLERDLGVLAGDSRISLGYPGWASGAGE